MNKETSTVEEIVKYHEICGNCGKPDGLMRMKLPEIYYNTLQALDYSIGDQYFKYNVNPDRQEVIISQEVKNRMAKERRDVVKIIGVIAAIGFAAMLALVGVSILLTTWPTFMSAQSAATVPAIVG